MPHEWDVEADVVVVGFGAAGVAAAVTAHEQGAKVLILEKAPEGEEGGNTRVAGQGYLNTSSVDSAIAYLTALCGPFTVPADMVQAWAEEMGQNNAWLASLGGDPQEHQHPPVGIEFPDLPGADCVHKFHDGPVYGYSNTWKRFESLVKQRPIAILYETPGRQLIQDDTTKEILGVRAQRGQLLADDIRGRWLATAGSLYRREGPQVAPSNLPPQQAGAVGGGGGEYPLQDGFGWTNGVTRRLLHEAPQHPARHVRAARRD